VIAGYQHYTAMQTKNPPGQEGIETGRGCEVVLLVPDQHTRLLSGKPPKKSPSGRRVAPGPFASSIIGKFGVYSESSSCSSVMGIFGVTVGFVSHRLSSVGLTVLITKSGAFASGFSGSF
jgi:hypothetical protein